MGLGREQFVVLCVCVCVCLCVSCGRHGTQARSSKLSYQILRYSLHGDSHTTDGCICNMARGAQSTGARRGSSSCHDVVELADLLS